MPLELSFGTVLFIAYCVRSTLFKGRKVRSPIQYEEFSGRNKFSVFLHCVNRVTDESI